MGVTRATVLSPRKKDNNAVKRDLSLNMVHNGTRSKMYYLTVYWREIFGLFHYWLNTKSNYLLLCSHFDILSVDTLDLPVRNYSPAGSVFFFLPIQKVPDSFLISRMSDGTQNSSHVCIFSVPQSTDIWNHLTHSTEV